MRLLLAFATILLAIGPISNAAATHNCVQFAEGEKSDEPMVTKPRHTVRRTQHVRNNCGTAVRYAIWLTCSPAWPDNSSLSSTKKIGSIEKSQTEIARLQVLTGGAPTGCNWQFSTNLNGDIQTSNTPTNVGAVAAPQTPASPPPVARLPSPSTPQQTHPTFNPTTVERCLKNTGALPFPTVPCDIAQYAPERPALKSQWQGLCTNQEMDARTYCEMNRDGVPTSAIEERAKARWKAMDQLLTQDAGAPPPARQPNATQKADGNSQRRYSIAPDLRTTCPRNSLFLVRRGESSAYNVNCPSNAASFCENSLSGRHTVDAGDNICIH